MKARIEAWRRNCQLKTCCRDGTHEVVDGYGKRIGPYCLEHAQRVLAEVETWERTSERAKIKRALA